jgi:hypothetical protein
MEGFDLVDRICIYLSSILNFERQSDTELSNIATYPHSSGGADASSASHIMALSILGLLVGMSVICMVARRIWQAKLPQDPLAFHCSGTYIKRRKELTG